jgi:hypothetical protein
MQCKPARAFAAVLQPRDDQETSCTKRTANAPAVGHTSIQTGGQPCICPLIRTFNGSKCLIPYSTGTERGVFPAPTKRSIRLFRILPPVSTAYHTPSWTLPSGSFIPRVSSMISCEPSGTSRRSTAALRNGRSLQPDAPIAYRCGENFQRGALLARPSIMSIRPSFNGAVPCRVAALRNCFDA